MIEVHEASVVSWLFGALLMCNPGRGPKNLYAYIGRSTQEGEDPRTSVCVKGEDPRTSNIFRPIQGKEGEDPSTSSSFSFLLLLLTGMCGHLMPRTCCIALQCLRSSCLLFFSSE